MSASRVRLAAWAVSFVAPLVVAAALIPVRTRFAGAAMALLLVAVVTVLAVLADRGAGYAATVSAAAWYDFYWAPPYGRFTIGHRPDLETFVALVVVGVGVTELAQWSRRSRQRHDESTRLVDAVAEGAALGASSEPARAVVARAEELLVEVLELRACRYEPGDLEPPRARLGLSGEVENAGLLWPVGEWGLPGPELEIAVTWRGRVRGRFVLTPRTAHPVSLERRVAAVAIAETVAGSLPGASVAGGP
ncbi:MAG TPA: DUF4118 domain-containing protein [Acidimicrobiales bacterium]|nr:DUF4118 domain-containing protein [Acidimicrobiales bacterium]